MGSPLKIGLDASNLRNGGGISHLTEFLRTADPSRHSFEKIVVWGGRDTLAKLPQNRDWLDLRDHAWLNGGSAKRLLWRKMHLYKELAQTSSLAFAPGGLVGKSPVPRVTMCRNMLPFDLHERARLGNGMSRVRFEMLKHAQSRSFMTAEGLIFLTDYARDAVLPQLPKKPPMDCVIPHGVGTRFSQAVRPQRDISDCTAATPYRFLYVSSVNVYKHQWRVIEAVGRLRQKGYNLRLDMVGGISDFGSGTLMKTEMERWDPQGTFVSYHGQVPFDKMHPLYREADGFVFASSCENLPNILLEAMSASLPIACADRRPMMDVLGPEGFYFDVDEQLSVDKALEEMILSPVRRGASALDAQARAQEYSWERCADTTFAFLLTVQKAQA